MGYKKLIIPPKVTVTCNILNHTPIYSTSHGTSIVVTTIFVHRTCRRRDLHQRQRIWRHRVAYLARNSAVTTIQDPRIMVRKLPLAKTVNEGNTPININRRMGMVTLLHSSHFQALRSFSPFTIQHDTQCPTNPQHKPTRSRIWATMATI